MYRLPSPRALRGLTLGPVRRPQYDIPGAQYPMMKELIPTCPDEMKRRPSEHLAARCGGGARLACLACLW
jgi:hypothetical protein